MGISTTKPKSNHTGFPATDIVAPGRAFVKGVCALGKAVLRGSEGGVEAGMAAAPSLDYRRGVVSSATMRRAISAIFVLDWLEVRFSQR